MKSQDPKILGSRLIELIAPENMSGAERSEMLQTLGVNVGAGWARLQRTLEKAKPAPANRRRAILDEIAALFSSLGADIPGGVLARKQLEAIGDHDLEQILETLRKRAAEKPQ